MKKLREFGEERKCKRKLLHGAKRTIGRVKSDRQ